ncbi:MAG TPA: DinB family protein [Thermoanaerobaculia bacterium]
MEITNVDSFLGYFDKIRERTLRVARCVPPDQLEWRYREGTFSFGDILRHLGAIERCMFAENAVLRPSRYPGHGRELADGYEEVFGYLNRMHAETVEILAGLSSADLQRKCVTPGGAELAVWKWLRSMVEHEVHHRGQIYVYLSMLGIQGPPLYGLTSEEVLARSSR